jgi:hypothetical protein
MPRVDDRCTDMSIGSIREPADFAKTKTTTAWFSIIAKFGELESPAIEKTDCEQRLANTEKQVAWLREDLARVERQR